MASALTACYEAGARKWRGKSQCAVSPLRVENELSTYLNHRCQVSDCLTLHIHRIKDENQLVFSPDSNRILEGIYTNNQHVLGM